MSVFDELFYVNLQAQPNGDHEVHRGSCDHLPLDSLLIYLGLFPSPLAAINAAEKRYPLVNGCIHCCASNRPA
jgi:hypothetical protein